MFKAVITAESTMIQGTMSEQLTGLSCYVEALKNNGFSRKIIEKVVEIGLEDAGEAKVETIIDNDKMKIQKYNLNNMTKEEAKDFLAKEIFNMFD